MALLFGVGFLLSGASFSFLAGAQWVLSAFLYPLIIFGINDIYDDSTDRINQRKKLFLHGAILEKEQFDFATKIAVGSTVVLALTSCFSRNGTNLVATALALAIAWVYSAPPIRLKERPPFDSLSNSLFLWSIVLVGFSYGSSVARLSPKVYFGSLIGATLHALSAVMDYEADQGAGMKTIATVFGKRGAAAFAFTTTLVVFLFSGIQTVSLRFMMGYLLSVSAILVFVNNEKLTRHFLEFGGFIVYLSVFLYLLERAKPYLPAFGVNLG